MDELALRRALGHFATGVSVITTVSPDGEPHGLTVNSFASLSLVPPQLIVCLKRENRSYAAFASAPHFAVNVLSEGQVGLSRLFASARERKFEGLEHAPGRSTGAPLLAGAHAWLECEVGERLEPPGTHAIVIGRLLAYEVGGAAPLLFHRGAYHRLGERIA
jgi:flavin reductase (DIM6/NTAB) family NADH-FMN oxidoreductase RutF